MSTAQFRAPFPLHPTALLDTADNSINNPGTGSPSRETIHRAISTAYYALFHAINASNADITHGGPTNTPTAQAWTDTYRQMRHNFAARHLNQHMFSFASNGRILAKSFADLKTARETADYDPNTVLTTGDANHWIRQSRTALAILQAMRPTERQTLKSITLTGHP